MLSRVGRVMVDQRSAGSIRRRGRGATTMRGTRSGSVLVLAAMVVSTLALVVGPIARAGAATPPPAGYVAGTSTGDALQGTESFQDEQSYPPEGIACFKATRSVYSVRGAGTYEGVTAAGQPVVYTATI